jgi:hypothetical protein
MSPPSTPCQIPELALSCYGCCGNTFTGKKKVEKDIVQNTIELEEFIENNDFESREDALNHFRDRYSGETLGPSGLCLNLVQFKSGCLACPLHNMINELVPKEEYVGPKEDLRQVPCDVNYECKTFKIWAAMGQEQRSEYVSWLSKRIDSINHYSYSMGNHDGKYIEQFLKERNEVLNEEDL